MRPDDSRPTYVQVADALREEIKQGSVAPGERLPSVRDLADRFDIAAVTVQSALRILRDEGYVVSRSTRGYFVRDELPATPAEPPSAEFLVLRDQLAEMRSLMREFGERLTHLESAVGGQEGAGPPPTAMRGPASSD